MNQDLEQAGRVADFMEFGELLCLDALTRRESCGGHFRTEFQTADGEARQAFDVMAKLDPAFVPTAGSLPMVHSAAQGWPSSS